MSGTEAMRARWSRGARRTARGWSFAGAAHSSVRIIFGERAVASGEERDGSASLIDPESLKEFFCSRLKAKHRYSTNIKQLDRLATYGDKRHRPEAIPHAIKYEGYGHATLAATARFLTPSTSPSSKLIATEMRAAEPTPSPPAPDDETGVTQCGSPPGKSHSTPGSALTGR